MTEPEQKIVIGINGPDIHTAILDPDEALRFAYQVIETVERMGANRHPDDFEEDED